MASEVTSDLEFELLYLKNLCSYASLVAIKTLFNKVSQDANIFRSSSVPQSLSGRAIDFLELRSEVKMNRFLLAYLLFLLAVKNVHKGALVTDECRNIIFWKDRHHILNFVLLLLSFTPTTSNSSGGAGGANGSISRITHADLVEHLNNLSNPDSRTGGTFNRSASFIAQAMVRSFLDIHLI